MSSAADALGFSCYALVSDSTKEKREQYSGELKGHFIHLMWRLVPPSLVEFICRGEPLLTFTCWIVCRLDSFDLLISLIFGLISFCPFLLTHTNNPDFWPPTGSFWFFFPLIVSYSTRRQISPSSDFVWLQSTLWQWLPNSLVLQGSGPFISKQFQSAQPSCFCQMLYKYFHVWYLELSQRLSQRMNTSALTESQKMNYFPYFPYLPGLKVGL